MFNPFTTIARTLFGPFKAAILETWRAARQAAFAEIHQEIQADADMAEARAVLAELSGQSPAIADAEAEPEKGRKKK